MDQLTNNLKGLRLSGFVDNLTLRQQEAKANELDYVTFLERLVEDEMLRRKENLLNRRIKMAKFPLMHSIDEFDFDFNPSISKAVINELSKTKFIYDAKNILFIGPPGVGKTHLAIALGLNSISNSYTVYYRNSFDLVEDMADAFRNDKRKKFVKALVKYDLLIIDEFGMKKMPSHAADDLLEIIHRRHGYGSTIIATNRPVSDWGTILGDNVATSAILDRFLENAEIFNIKGKSYRMNKKN